MRDTKRPGEGPSGHLSGGDSGQRQRRPERRREALSRQVRRVTSCCFVLVSLCDAVAVWALLARRTGSFESRVFEFVIGYAMCADCDAVLPRQSKESTSNFALCSRICKTRATTARTGTRTHTSLSHTSQLKNTPRERPAPQTICGPARLRRPTRVVVRASSRVRRSLTSA